MNRKKGLPSEYAEYGGWSESSPWHRYVKVHCLRLWYNRFKSSYKWHNYCFVRILGPNSFRLEQTPFLKGNKKHFDTAASPERYQFTLTRRNLTSMVWQRQRLSCWYTRVIQLQSNLNSPNTDGSFTMAKLNSFLSPYVSSSDCSRKQIF